MPGNSEEFIALLKPHYNDALRYSRALCKDHNDAQDLLQQSLVNALEKLPTLRDQEKFKSWYFKIITRTFYTQHRKKFWRRFLPLGSSDGSEELLDTFAEDPGSERKIILLNALDQLSPKERAALLLFEVGGFSLRDICEIQEEKSLSAIKSRLSRTRQRLKVLIIAFEEKRNFTNQNKDLANETQQLASAKRK